MFSQRHILQLYAATLLLSATVGCGANRFETIVDGPSKSTIDDPYVDPDDPRPPVEPPPVQPPPVEPPPVEPPPVQPPPVQPPPVQPPPVKPPPVQPPPVEPPPVQPPPAPVLKSETEVFNQDATGGKADILFVVDNSDSMLWEHKREWVKKQFKGFLNTLKGIDWQIGVTTTDMRTMNYYRNINDGPYRQGPREGFNGKLDFLHGSTTQRILKPDMENAESIFLNTIHRLEPMDCMTSHPITTLPCGSNIEEPLKATISAITRKRGDNYGFFRDGADLVTIAISDEDEMADGPAQATKPEQVLAHVKQEFNNLKKFRMYGVVIEPEDKKCLDKQHDQGWIGQSESYYGRHVAALAQATGGRTTSICKENVVDDLKVIGDSLRSGLTFENVTLKHTPAPNTLDVSFSPQRQIKVTLTGRKVSFDPVPPAGTKVTIKYKRVVPN